MTSGLPRIVLKKSFFAMIKNSQDRWCGLAHGDVRVHIKYSKTGCWRSYRFHRASQRLKSPTCIICEILGGRDFRVFQHNPPVNGHRWWHKETCSCKEAVEAFEEAVE